MVIIESFDQNPIENIVSAIALHPDKLIFLGGNRDEFQKQCERMEQLFHRRGLRIDIEYKNINQNKLKHVIETLTDIVRQEEDLCFELTGGFEVVLAAMGIVYEQFKNTKKIQMHRYNIRTGRITDCDGDGIIPDDERPRLSVSECIQLYGGKIVYEDPDGAEKTTEWDFEEQGFAKDINSLWSICRQNPSRWNSQIGTLKAAAQSGTLCGMQKTLENSGFIKVESGEKGSRLSYKNTQIAKCLQKAGTVLELKSLLLARAMMDTKGAPYFHDCANGVFIDWDGILHTDRELEKDTENEIDLILMRGLVPVFVSCKNGIVEEEELYKLNTVANRFGGPYAVKVLIATTLGRGTDNNKGYFRQRAEDMNICLIEGVHEMGDEEIAAKILEKV